MAAVTSTGRPETRRSHDHPGLQSVRALAASLVVVHHAAVLAGGSRSGVLATPASAMDVGVSIFFVLSGFLIYRPFAATNAGTGPAVALGPFWWRRLLRVMPAYWLAFCFFWAIGVIRPTGLVDLLAHLSLLNVFRPESLFNGISQGWSLTAEMMFYATVPAYAAGVRRLTRRHRAWHAEWWALGAVVAAAHLFRVLTHAGDLRYGAAELSGISYLWLPTHMDLIAVGMGLAVLWVHRDRSPVAARVATGLSSTGWWWTVALVVFAAYAYGLGGPSVTEGYSLAHLEIRQIAYGVIGLGVVAPVVFGGGGAFRRVLEWSPLLLMGQLSYGLYLWHNDWMERIAAELADDPPSWALRFGDGLGDLHVGVLLATGFGLGLVGAAVSWYGVEHPIQRARHLLTSPERWAEALGARALGRVGPAIIALAALAPLRGLMTYQGPPMEEGFMLTFPQELLAGRLPHRDFLHLYGPGSLWVLAGIYRVFGVSLGIERTVGFLQHLVVALAMYHLVSAWGRRIATAAGLTALVILISPLGLSAMAWNGALAWAMVGLVAADRARTASTDPLAVRWAAVAGACGAAALLYRPDLVVALGAAAAIIAMSATRVTRRPLVLSFGAVSSLWIVHLATSGPVAALRGMFIEPVFQLRPGRRLPVPPSWDRLDGFLQRAGGIRVVGWPLPMPAVSVQVALWFWLVPLTSVVLAVTTWRRRSDLRISRLAPAVAFGVLLFTQALQRPDTAHLSWVTAVTLPLCLPLAASVIAERWPSWPAARRSWAALAPVVVVLVVIIPFYPLRTYADLVGQSLGFHRFGFVIERGDRRFYYGDADAASAAQAVVDELDLRSEPGQRLIVGPVDLSRTAYSDAFFYYLFPELPPGTRYIEMDPGIADRDDSGLAEELARADWLILSDAWSGWDEPNASVDAGSQGPNEVVASSYCTVVDAGTFELLQRCR